MARGILTNREVKNKVTGVDIYVSDYQEVPHRIKNDYLYHVIVVSNLFYYKTREHRESDVVQFMISKTFGEFEDLYKRLYKRFPSVNFPPLPEKSLFSKDPSGHLECMDKVLKMVAATQKLSSSPMVISFLRGDPLPNVPNEEDDLQDEQKRPEVPEDVKEPSVENESDFQDVDLFERKPQVEIVVEDEICVENIEPVLSSGKSIFDEEEENDDDLFSITETKTNESNKVDGLAVNLDIFELSDEVDELMNLSKTSEKQLSIKVNKPRPAKAKVNQSKRSTNLFNDNSNEKEDMFKKSKTKPKSLWSDHNHHTLDDIFSQKKTSFFDVDDDDDLFRSSISKKQVKVEDMKQEDILDYIKSHEDTSVPTEQAEQNKPTEDNSTYILGEPVTSILTEDIPATEQAGVCLEFDDTSLSMEPTSTADLESNSITVEIVVPEIPDTSLQSDENDTCISVPVNDPLLVQDVPSESMEEVCEPVMELMDSSTVEQDVLVFTEHSFVSNVEQLDESPLEQDNVAISTEEVCASIADQPELQINTYSVEQVNTLIVEKDEELISTEQTDAYATQQVHSFFLETNDIVSTEQNEVLPTQLMDDSLVESCTSITKQMDISLVEQDTSLAGEQMSPFVMEQIECSIEEQDDSGSLDAISVEEVEDPLAVHDHDDPSVTIEQRIVSVTEHVHEILVEQDDILETSDPAPDNSLISEEPIDEQNEFSIVVEPCEPSVQDLTSLEQGDTSVSVEENYGSFVEETHTFDLQYNNPSLAFECDDLVLDDTTDLVVEQTNDCTINQIDTFFDEQLNISSTTQDDTYCSEQQDYSTAVVIGEEHSNITVSHESIVNVIDSYVSSENLDL